jgi:DNA-binding transcriptional MerR regulator
MSDEYIESGAASKIIGAELRRLQSWVEHELVRPAVRGTGRGERRRHKFDARNLTALCVARDLRRRGFTIAQCGSVLQRLSSNSPEELRECWELGRTCLLAVGCHSLPLLSHDVLFNNPHLPLKQAFDLGLPVSVVDTQKAFDQITEQLTATQSESQEAAPCVP